MFPKGYKKPYLSETKTNENSEIEKNPETEKTKEALQTSSPPT